MKVTLQRIKKMQFRAVADGGRMLVFDAAPEVGGEGEGVRPMEAVLAALGACGAIDVLLILQKGRQAIDACTIHIDAERVDATPAVFRSIHLRYVVGGANVNLDKVERAVALSLDKYCSVAHMLQPDVRITHEVELIAT